MESSYMDLRIVRTREFIFNALIDLIEEKGFEKITVTDITKRAKINRGTFYSHYEDKFDLLEKCEANLMREMEKKLVNKLPLVISEIEGSYDKTIPFIQLVPMFEYLYENKKFIKILLTKSIDSPFQAKLKMFMHKMLFSEGKHSIFKKEDLLVSPNYLVSYISSAHLGVIQEWLVNDKEDTPEEIARIIATMTINGPFYAAGLKNR